MLDTEVPTETVWIGNHWIENVMPWPMKAPGPTPLPCGTIPPGNGLLSVVTGVVRLLLLYCVVWLKPAWLTRYKLLRLTVAPVFEFTLVQNRFDFRLSKRKALLQ